MKISLPLSSNFILSKFISLFLVISYGTYTNFVITFVLNTSNTSQVGCKENFTKTTAVYSLYPLPLKHQWSHGGGRAVHLPFIIILHHDDCCILTQQHGRPVPDQTHRKQRTYLQPCFWDIPNSSEMGRLLCSNQIPTYRFYCVELHHHDRSLLTQQLDCVLSNVPSQTQRKQRTNVQLLVARFHSHSKFIWDGSHYFCCVVIKFSFTNFVV